MKRLWSAVRLVGRQIEAAAKRVVLSNLSLGDMRPPRFLHRASGDATVGVAVELRMWRAGGVSRSEGLRPVAVPAVLTKHDNEPTVMIEDDDGDTLPLPPEELVEQCFGSVLILREPSARQAQLISEAVARGYAVEPRLVGKTVLALEELR